MTEEKKSIFRQKSLDRISSPEELDQYLQVTKPAIWLVLGAVIILLIGFISWGFLGHLTTKIPVAVEVKDGRAVCYIPESQSKYIESQKIQIGEQSYPLIKTGLAKEIVGSETAEEVKRSGHLADGDIICPFAIDGTLTEGYYQGEIVIEQVKPMHFILN